MSENLGIMAGKEKLTSAGLPGSTAKALGILEAVVASARPASIAELSSLLGLSKPTGHRIASTLEELGFLKREPGTRRFIEGDRLVALALSVLEAAAKRGPRHAILQALSKEIGETCNLGVLAGNEVVYLDRVEAEWPLGLRFEPGSRVPAHCTAIGKMFLSRMETRRGRQFVRTVPLRRYTDNTITDPDRLLKELERIREHDVATDNQEFMSGVVCVAVPVLGPGNRMCAAVALSAPEARLTLEQALDHVPALRRAAKQLSETFVAEG